MSAVSPEALRSDRVAKLTRERMDRVEAFNSIRDLWTSDTHSLATDSLRHARWILEGDNLDTPATRRALALAALEMSELLIQVDAVLACAWSEAEYQLHREFELVTPKDVERLELREMRAVDIAHQAQAIRHLVAKSPISKKDWMAIGTELKGIEQAIADDLPKDFAFTAARLPPSPLDAAPSSKPAPKSRRLKLVPKAPASKRAPVSSKGQVRRAS